MIPVPAEEVTLPLTAVRYPERGFARSMRRLRLARGWTLRQLAEESGVRISGISRMEGRLSGCNLVTAWRIAGALGVTVDAMIREEAQ